MEIGVIIITVTVILGFTGWLKPISRMSDYATNLLDQEIDLSEEYREISVNKRYAKLDSKAKKAVENGKYMTKKQYKQNKKARASEILRSTANSSTEA